MFIQELPQDQVVLQPSSSTTTPPSVLISSTTVNSHAVHDSTNGNVKSSATINASWEYLMPKRKERMAGYIRESDPSLADSTTIESAAKAIREYGKRQGYIYEPKLEFKEAISAYTVPYMERKRLLDMLELARRHEFDVLVVTEVRAISRRQVEVFIVYDILQKLGIRLETIHEKFEDDAMGRIILGLRAGYAEIEREQSYQRMQRGKRDRVAIGQAPNGHPKAAYGLIFVDNDREVKHHYKFNTAIMYVDRNEKAWSEHEVRLFIFDLLEQRVSLQCICNRLNELAIPTPKGKARKGQPHWQICTIRSIAQNPIAYGEVWANRYKKVNRPNGKNSMVHRPKEEWIRLPDAPAIITKERFDAIQEQFTINKEESMRNSHISREESGLLRAGYIRCGICGNAMIVSPRHGLQEGYFSYSCRKRGKVGTLRENHRTQIYLPTVDRAAIEKVIEVVNNPAWIRARVDELREENKPPPVSQEDVEVTLAQIQKQMDNLINLAQYATDDTTIAQLTNRLNELETERRKAEGLLYNIEDEEAVRQVIEEEIVKFEVWAENVRPYLNDPAYQPTYEELRLAIRILGLVVTVYPTQGDYPYRFQIDVTIPAIMAKVLEVPCIDAKLSLRSLTRRNSSR